MKKIFVFLAAIAASLLLVSCGGSSSGANNESARKVDAANELLVQLLNRFNICTGGYDSGPVIQLTQEFRDAYEALDEKGREQIDTEIAKRGKEAPDFLDYMVLVGFVDGKESVGDMAYRYFSDWFSTYSERDANERRIKRLKLGLQKDQEAAFKAGRDRFLDENHPRARASLPFGL